MLRKRLFGPVDAIQHISKDDEVCSAGQRDPPNPAWSASLCATSRPQRGIAGFEAARTSALIGLEIVASRSDLPPSPVGRSP